MRCEEVEAMNTEFNESEILSIRSVQLAAAFDHKNDVIRAASELLVQVGAVDKCYLASMLQREAITNTWLGNGIAIPQGMVESHNLIIRDAVTVIQIPAGIEWRDGKKVRWLLPLRLVQIVIERFADNWRLFYMIRNGLKNSQRLGINNRLLQLYLVRI